MFYDTAADDHGLPRNPFKACVAPRPIGWISTLSAGGIANLAPYSFFNGMGSAPPVVVFGSNNPGPGGPKDSLRNIEQTGEFVVNIATITLKEQMNATSATLPPEVDEFIHAGLEKAASRLVKPPRVAASPIHLECRHMQTVRLPTTAQFPDAHNAAVFGLVPLVLAVVAFLAAWIPARRAGRLDPVRALKAE